MGRPFKLRRHQWANIERRIDEGEGIRKLAREHGITPTAIRNHLNSHVRPLKLLAKQVAKVESELEALPFNSQVAVRNYADNIKGVVTHLAVAAENGAMTARKLSHVARIQSEQIDEAAPFDETEDGTPSNAAHLRSVAAMIEVANNAAKIGLGLVASNKDAMRSAGKKTDITPIKIPDDPIEATRVYMAMIHGVGRP